LAERLDALVGQGGDSADNACRRRRPEFFSRHLVRQRIIVGAHRNYIHGLRRGFDRRQAITNRLARKGIQIHLPIGQTEAHALYKQALSDLRKAQQEHEPNRRAELATSLNSGGKSTTLSTNHKKAIKKIDKAERNRATYRILDAIKNRNGYTQKLDRLEVPTSWPAPFTQVTDTTSLEDPKSSTEWKLITAPAEIEYYLLLRNQRHFGQAQGTPFTIPPLSDDLDWGASTTSADDILAGSYESPIDIPQCTTVIKACKAAADLDQISAEITYEEFRGKIRSWRETTCTSPSGRHLGRYRALFARGIYDAHAQEEEYELFKSKQRAIVDVILSIINYAIRQGYVLERWKTIVNTMIFKDVGVFKIHRLRIIHIYEADFNLLLATKWRQLLRYADEANLINQGQYGGRPGCEAQSLALLEELKNDIAYTSRRSLLNFDNDAASCYDRIIIALASLINRKYGQHRKIVLVHAQTLKDAEYRLRTATGISNTKYSHCLDFPLYGSGQGSGNSPCIWLFISSTLFDIQNAKAHGAKFISPDGTTSMQLAIVGFVDDSNGTTNDFQPQSQEELPTLLTRMQEDAQLWNDLLFCSGGQLELSKCSFHVLHFNFLPNGKPVPSKSIYPNTIKLRDPITNVQVPITSLPAHCPHKTLGHYKSPVEAPTSKHLVHLSSIAKQTSLLISTSPITRAGALLAYHTVYVPRIKYSLPQSFFTTPKLQKAQRPSMGPIIAKCGFNRHAPHAVLFASPRYAGAGFLHWQVLQGEGQVIHFLKHWRTKTILSSALRIALSWSQWQAGISRAILGYPRITVPHLEARWINSLRQFLASIRGRIQVDIDYVQPKEREGDKYIMEMAMQSRLFTRQEMQIINYCRLFLHVTTVSELFNATGTQILPDMFNCHRPPWFNTTTYITLQRRPSDYQIKYCWQRLLRQICTSTGTLAASMHLGPFLTSAYKLRLR